MTNIQSTKISTVITGLFINAAVYNSRFKNLLLTSIPLGITSVLYHIFEIKKIRYLDMFFAGLACSHFSYLSYHTSNIKSLLLFMNSIPIYLFVKILEKHNKKYSDYMHSFMHYWLILSTVFFLKK